jgi:hypothetical protein
LNRRSPSERGASLVEFHIVAVLGALPVLLGMLQVFLLLLAAHTVQFASAQAARAGAVHGANPAAMRRAFTLGLVPLLVASVEEPGSGNVVPLVGAAWSRASAEALVFAQVEILSPDAAAFADFATPGPDGMAIRNDGLEQRPVTRGARSGLSIQEANLLRVRARWCQPLIVPFAGELLVSALRVLDADAFAQRCYAAGRIPLAGDAAVNMQSDVRYYGG